MTLPTPLDDRLPRMRAVLWGAGFAALAAVAAITVAYLLGTDPSLARVQSAHVLRVGYAVEPPYAYLEPDGTVTGEAPEIARLMAAKLGIARIEWRLVEFGGLLDALDSDQIDVVAAGMFITPERERRFAFSLPTFRVRDALLVRRGNPAHLRSVNDLLAPGATRLAVLTGSFEQAYLRKLGVAPARLVVAPDARTARALVWSGGADGLMLSGPSVRWMARTDGGATEVVEGFESAGGYAHVGAFVFRQEDRALRDAWNRALASFVGSPEHRALAARFALLPAELAPGPPGAH